MRNQWVQQEVDKVALTNSHAKKYQKDLERFLISLYTKFKESYSITTTVVPRDTVLPRNYDLAYINNLLCLGLKVFLPYARPNLDLIPNPSLDYILCLIESFYRYLDGLDASTLIEKCNMVNEILMQGTGTFMTLGLRVIPNSNLIINSLGNNMANSGNLDWIFNQDWIYNLLHIPRYTCLLALLFINILYKWPIRTNLLAQYNAPRFDLQNILYRGNNMRKELVEIITSYKGLYGRFFVLVCLGFGCTVWYRVAPGSIGLPPAGPGFEALSNHYLQSFFEHNHEAPGFKKLFFLQEEDIASIIEMSLRGVEPFPDMEIPPCKGESHTAVSLAAIIVFIFSFLPHIYVSGEVEI